MLSVSYPGIVLIVPSSKKMIYLGPILWFNWCPDGFVHSLVEVAFE